MPRKIVPSESSEQAAVVQWARNRAGLYPELALLFAIPNGAALSGVNDGRHWAQARKLAAEGRLAGIPDLCLPVARAGFHSLYIEMKRIGGKTSADQDFIIDRLRAEGHRVEVCEGAPAAIRVITEYLGLRNEIDLILDL